MHLKCTVLKVLEEVSVERLKGKSLLYFSCTVMVRKSTLLSKNNAL